MVVFDTDGLIKLTSSGILSQLSLIGFISEEVYQEAVVAGKQKFYPDALIMEGLVQAGKIKIEQVKYDQIPKLGKGELSSLALYYHLKADFIISDDRQFLTYLEEQGVPFLVPSEFLLFLALTKQVKKKDGLEALEKIKNLITVENYYDAKNALED